MASVPDLVRRLAGSSAAARHAHRSCADTATGRTVVALQAEGCAPAQPLATEDAV